MNHKFESLAEDEARRIIELNNKIVKLVLELEYQLARAEKDYRKLPQADFSTNYQQAKDLLKKFKDHIENGIIPKNILEKVISDCHFLESAPDDGLVSNVKQR